MLNCGQRGCSILDTEFWTQIRNFVIELKKNNKKSETEIKKNEKKK